MKEIPLTNGGIALCDDDDYEMLAQHKWYAWHKATNCPYYAMTNIRVNGHKTTISMHKCLLGSRGDDEIDHKDNNGFNNQRANLRFCTKTQNQANAKLRISNKSGYKGVTRNGKNWSASVCLCGRAIHLGTYVTLESAALAYDEAATRYYGEFALTNKMLGLI